MSDDYENTPLKDKNGEIIRYHNGKPILYKHFLNDLPDEEHDKATEKDSERLSIDLFLRFGTSMPKKSNISKDKVEKRRKELQALGIIK